ncbi:Ras GTPase-activating protein 1 [Gonapodya sp. JEL0774]|nr:Ras GTPase-activating protein 1 [Gonapodya sp. JEL0774]
MVDVGRGFQDQLQEHYTELKKAKTQVQDIQQKVNVIKERSGPESVKTQVKHAATQDKLEEAIRAMQLAEASATDAQTRYFSVSMPTLLGVFKERVKDCCGFIETYTLLANYMGFTFEGKFAVEEERRCLTVKNTLLEYHRTVKFYQEVQTRIVDSLGEMLDGIDGREDLETFLEMHVNTEELQDHKISARTLINPKISGRVDVASSDDESWKPRFLVLMGEEKRLYCFNAEDSDKPRFIVDLSRRVHVSPLDESLFAKPHCLQLVVDTSDYNDFKNRTVTTTASPQRSLVIYLNVETDAQRHLWIEALREMSACCDGCAGGSLSRQSTANSNSKSAAPPDGVHAEKYKTTRSIDIKVLEAKDISGLPMEIYCMILLNDLKRAKTRACHGANPFWGETYLFEEVSPCTRKLKFVLYSRQKLSKDQEIGFVSINLLKLKSRQKVEDWFPVAPANGGESASDNLASLRLSITLLNESEYLRFVEIVTEPRATCIQVLAQVNSKREDLAKTFVNILMAQGKETQILAFITSEEIRRTDDPNVLFRANSLASKALDVFLKIVAADYLKTTIGSLIKTIYKNARESLEIDPTRVSDATEIKRRWQKLLAYCSSFATAIFRSVEAVPPQLRVIFSEMAYAAADTFPDTMEIKYRAISAFIFLRFFCAAILSPKLFGLANQHPDPTLGRNLTLIAKIVQNLASLTLFEAKEPHMCDANEFISENMMEMRVFLDKIADSQIRVDLGRELEHLYFFFLDSLEELKLAAGKQIRLLSTNTDATKKTNRSQFLFAHQEASEVASTMSRLYSTLADLQVKHEEWEERRTAFTNTGDYGTSGGKLVLQLPMIHLDSNIVQGSDSAANIEQSPSTIPSDDVPSPPNQNRNTSRTRFGGMMVRDPDTGKLLGAVVPTQHARSQSASLAPPPLPGTTPISNNTTQTSPISPHPPFIPGKPRKSSSTAVLPVGSGHGDFSDLFKLFAKDKDKY